MDIDLKALKKHDARVSAIYFLFHEDKLVYIGQTKNLMMRVGHHIYRQKIIFDQYAFVEVAEKDLNRIERELIEKHRPPCNTAFGPYIRTGKEGNWSFCNKEKAA